MQYNTGFPGNALNYKNPSNDVGLDFDNKKCWESTESHFICLDKFNEVYDNHQKCPDTYKSWNNDCLPIARRNQVIQRALMKETVRNYGSQANVDRYNKERENLPGYTESKGHYIFGPSAN